MRIELYTPYFYYPTTPHSPSSSFKMTSRASFSGPGVAGSAEEGVLMGMGNPLLDISAVVPMAICEKYGVLMGNAILAEDKHLPLYKELVDDFKVDYVAGGATQNSIRVAQWMLQSKGATSYAGGVGKDAFQQQLQAAAEKDGVKALYCMDEATPTGTCAVLVNEGERSLIANLSAANTYKHAHTMKPEVQAAIAKAKVFYTAGFFLTVPEGPESMMHVAEHAAANDKLYCFNLSAPFLVDFFADQMNKILPYTDFVFANESEAECFAKKQGWGEDLFEVAGKLARMPKASGANARTVIFTQGDKSTIVARNGVVTEYPVPKLNKDQIVDTNGAGDAFVGGFLARLVLGCDIAECVRAGHYAARVVIQKSGCTFPVLPDV